MEKLSLNLVAAGIVGESVMSDDRKGMVGSVLESFGSKMLKRDKIPWLSALLLVILSNTVSTLPRVILPPTEARTNSETTRPRPSDVPTCCVSERSEGEEVKSGERYPVTDWVLDGDKTVDGSGEPYEEEKTDDDEEEEEEPVAAEDRSLLTIT